MSSFRPALTDTKHETSSARPRDVLRELAQRARILLRDPAAKSYTPRKETYDARILPMLR